MKAGSPSLIAGRKVTLPLLVGYQEKSVVSRVILNSEEGTVTVFAFDSGEGLSEHTAPYDALVQILEGDAQVTISGKTTLLHQGEAIILPAGVSHALSAPARFKMLLTMIRARTSLHWPNREVEV